MLLEMRKEEGEVGWEICWEISTYFRGVKKEKNHGMDLYLEAGAEGRMNMIAKSIQSIIITFIRTAKRFAQFSFFC
jgi:hypothetical protein